MDRGVKWGVLGALGALWLAFGGAALTQAAGRAAMAQVVGGAALAQAAGRASLVVDCDKPAGPVSPLLYGIFFEEINHAGDGGLYAELVRNRSFEDAATPEAWTLLAPSPDHAAISLDDSRPLNERNRRSLRLEVRRVDGGRAAVANEGFWGIALRRGESYRLSLYARASEGAIGELRVTLESPDGRVLAEGRVSGLSSEWKRHELRLRARATEPKARLVLAPSRPGTLWLDVVSLFPARTWKGRANGLRRDLAELLDGLRPAFVRFPGGCFVEGSSLAEAYRWKNTIGDIAWRPTHGNSKWGYHSSDGLGFHEYLQLCEDLGAEPLFVINCGMACAFNGGEVVAMDQLDEWVQDALDALEYANGPVSSRWGALRAANGHPKPFGLKYLEIGNENGWGDTLPLYEERYARFYDAVKARYPDVQIIATAPVKSRPMDILDEHFYQTPEWFVANASRYDDHDRKGPRIYVGEYAVTSGSPGQGNLRAALGEAAFMTGLERNSDLVTMSSYAPLFVNVNNRAWNPDLIGFDNARSYGTPSYYVQQLFSRNRPEVLLPSRLEVEAPAEPGRGAIGVGTWQTQAEYRDLRVTHRGQTLYQSDFSQGTEGWRFLGGEWRAVEGALRQSAGGNDRRAVAGDPGWGDITLSLKARKLGGSEGFLVLFRVRGDRDWIWWNLGGWGNTQHGLEKSVGGAKRILGSQRPGRIETGRWYDIRVELSGPRIRCYLDGVLIHEAHDAPLPPLTAVAGRAENGDVILKVVNTSGSPVETEVDLRGAGASSLRGDLTLLTSASPMDENSLEEPRKVAPRTRRLANLPPRFVHLFPAHSLTVLRLRAR